MQISVHSLYTHLSTHSIKLQVMLKTLVVAIPGFRTLQMTHPLVLNFQESS